MKNYKQLGVAHWDSTKEQVLLFLWETIIFGLGLFGLVKWKNIDASFIRDYTYVLKFFLVFAISIVSYLVIYKGLQGLMFKVLTKQKLTVCFKKFSLYLGVPDAMLTRRQIYVILCVPSVAWLIAYAIAIFLAQEAFIVIGIFASMLVFCFEILKNIDVLWFISVKCKGEILIQKWMFTYPVYQAR